MSKVIARLKALFAENPRFTGSVEFHFKDGELKDTHVVIRYNEEGK
jgi:hypothetical protein